MPSSSRDARGRSQTVAGAGSASSAVGSALPPPPPYNPTAGRGRRGRENDAAAGGGRGSDVGNHRRRGSGSAESGGGVSARRTQQNGTGSARDTSVASSSSDYRRGGASSSSSRAAPVVVTNQDGKKVDVNRQGHGGNTKGGSAGGGAAPRVVHRVGMECLSPINVSRGDGPSTGGECVCKFGLCFVSAMWVGKDEFWLPWKHRLRLPYNGALAKCWPIVLRYYCCIILHSLLLSISTVVSSFCLRFVVFAAPSPIFAPFTTGSTTVSS